MTEETVSLHVGATAGCAFLLGLAMSLAFSTAALNGVCFCAAPPETCESLAPSLNSEETLARILRGSLDVGIRGGPIREERFGV